MRYLMQSWHNQHACFQPSYRLSVWISLISLCTITMLSGCSSTPQTAELRTEPEIQGHASHLRPPVIEPKSRYGNPEHYCVNNICYRTLAKADGYKERGIASWYGPNFHGHLTSNREVYDMYGMTAAHKTLPLPSYVQVSNLSNGKSIIVRVNDRGPFHDGRIIDLSYTAAAKLGILQHGTGIVEVAAVNPADNPLPQLLLSKTQEARLLSYKSEHPGAVPQLFIQVGAFSDRYKAEHVAAKLSPTLASTARIQPLQAATKPLYRVQFGPVDSVEHADGLTTKLRQLGMIDTQVIVE